MGNELDHIVEHLVERAKSFKKSHKPDMEAANLVLVEFFQGKLNENKAAAEGSGGTLVSATQWGWSFTYSNSDSVSLDIIYTHIGNIHHACLLITRGSF